MKKIARFLVIVSGTIFPLIVHAQVTLTNPLGQTDPRLLISRIINGALSVSGSIALLMFVYGGLVWLTSMGKPDAITKGRNILIWSILGLIVISLAYVATDAIFNALLTGDVARA
ncbi:MAG: hypothetical protein ABIA47_04080 [bacterium]